MTTKPDLVELLARVLSESPSAREAAHTLILPHVERMTAALEGPAAAEPTRGCVACGERNPTEAPFCLACGRDVDAEHPNHWTCTHCAALMGPSSEACGACFADRRPGQGTGPDPFATGGE